MSSNTLQGTSEVGIQGYGVDGGVVVGLDLGPSHSQVGVFRGETFEIIPDSQGRTKTPSYVSFYKEDIMAGHPAQALAEFNAGYTFHNIRNLLGRHTSDTIFKKEAKKSSIDLVAQPDNTFAIKLRINEKPRVFTAEEILAHLIRKLKDDAESYLEAPVTQVTMTVPAHFDDNQRAAMKKAGQLAGVEVLRLINEPTAAGIAHGIEDNVLEDNEGKVLFFDINEATCHGAVVWLEEGIYEILAKTSVDIASKENVSGKDLDLALLNRVTSIYNEENGVDITKDLGAMGRLRMQVERAEKELSLGNSATITIQPRRNASLFTCETSPEEYHRLHEELFHKIIPAFEKVLADAEVQLSEIDLIVMTGDITRVQKMKPFLTTHFGKPVIENIPSDEAFVRGAARQAHVLSQPIGDILCCLDINSLSLGFEIEGGLFQKLIPRNTIVPTRKSVNITTVTSDQTKIVLRIFEGERPFTKFGNLVGEIEMTDVVAGSVFEVSFDLDPDRKLKAILKDLGTDRNSSVVVDLPQITDHDEIEAVLVEMEKNFEEDELAKQVVLSSIDAREHVVVEEGVRAVT